MGNRREEGRPGYGLYDRALGGSYLQGLWEALAREPASCAEVTSGSG